MTTVLSRKCDVSIERPWGKYVESDVAVSVRVVDYLSARCIAESVMKLCAEYIICVSVESDVINRDSGSCNRDGILAESICIVERSESEGFGRMTDGPNAIVNSSAAVYVLYGRSVARKREHSVGERSCVAGYLSAKGGRGQSNGTVMIYVSRTIGITLE